MYYIGTLRHMIVVAFVRLLRGLCEPLSVALRSLIVHGCPHRTNSAMQPHDMCVSLCVCVCVYVWRYIRMSQPKFGGIGKAQLVRNAASLHGTCLEHCSALYSAAFLINCIPLIRTKPNHAHMGQIPQDGNLGQNVSLFLEKKVEPLWDQT